MSPMNFSTGFNVNSFILTWGVELFYLVSGYLIKGIDLCILFSWCLWAGKDGLRLLISLSCIRTTLLSICFLS